MVSRGAAPHERRAASFGASTDRRRSCRGLLPAGDRGGATSGGAFLAVAGGNEPRPVVARTAACEPGTQVVVARLPPLHRGIRNRGSRCGKDSARLSSLSDERVPKVLMRSATIPDRARITRGSRNN